MATYKKEVLSQLASFYDLHKKRLRDIAESGDSLENRKKKLLEIEQIMEVFDTVRGLLNDELFLLDVLKSIEKNNTTWSISTEINGLIHCVLWYDSKACYHALHTNCLFSIEERHWLNNGEIAHPTFQLRNNKEVFFGIHEVDLIADAADKKEESIREKSIRLYRRVFSQVHHHDLSSAMFYVYNGIHCEPVFLFREKGKTYVLTTSSKFCHSETQKLIKEFGAKKIHCAGLPMTHEGDCSMYCQMNINAVSLLASQEKSFVHVLRKIRDNAIDLKHYYVSYSDLVGKDVLLQPDAISTNRLLSVLMKELKKSGLDAGMKKLCIKLGISPNELTLIHPKTGKRPTIFLNDDHLHLMESAEALFNQLNIIQLKAEELKSRGYPNAAQQAEKLFVTIHSHAEQFFAKKIDYPKFRENSTRAIEDARNVLEKHRGWKQFLGNLALAIVGLGVFYAVCGLINKAVTGHFLFFKTDSVHKLDALQYKINTMPVA